jgi:DNA-binding CsgD family transcriptional regulator
VVKLTAMELSVLQCMALGDTYQQAGHVLGISRDSAKFAGERAQHKLGARNVTHAAVLALDAGLVHPYGCGDTRTYWWHYRRGEPIDLRCLEARAAYQRGLRRRQAAR